MSFFRNDGNSSLAALGMVITMGVVPLALAAGVIGGIGWLGYLGIKAAVALATTGSVAGAVSPAVVAGTALGGGALFAAATYTGVTQALWRQFSMKVLRRPDPDKPQAQKPPEKTSGTWQQMIKERNARNGFTPAAQKDAPAKEGASRANTPAVPKSPTP